MDTIEVKDFAKLDIRVGTIEVAENLEGSDKLLRLEINFGDFTLQILAGIKKHIDNPQTLVAKQVPVIVNLKPRKMMGLESQGMMLAAVDNGKPILLHPAKSIENGTHVS